MDDATLRLRIELKQDTTENWKQPLYTIPVSADRFDFKMPIRHSSIGDCSKVGRPETMAVPFF